MGNGSDNSPLHSQKKKMKRQYNVITDLEALVQSLLIRAKRAKPLICIIDGDRASFN